jgi:hypothetical protein
VALHLRDLARLRQARDRIDREHAQPLDAKALACRPGTPPASSGAPTASRHTAI